MDFDFDAGMRAGIIAAVRGGPDAQEIRNVLALLDTYGALAENFEAPASGAAVVRLTMLEHLVEMAGQPAAGPPAVAPPKPARPGRSWDAAERPAVAPVTTAELARIAGVFDVRAVQAFGENPAGVDWLPQACALVADTIAAGRPAQLAVIAELCDAGLTHLRGDLRNAPPSPPGQIESPAEQQLREVRAFAAEGALAAGFGATSSNPSATQSQSQALQARPPMPARSFGIPGRDGSIPGREGGGLNRGHH